MHDRKHDLEHEPIGRLLMRYSAPAIFAMMVNSLYNLVDTIFVGQGAGTLALAGLAVSFPIQMCVLAIAQVIGIGSASVISRSLGAGDARRAERTAGTSFVAVTVLSAALTAGGLTFLKPLLRAFGATPEVLPYGEAYLSVIIAGSFFFAFAVSTNGIVRAEGNARVSMISMCIGALSNVILDPIFIFGLKMGIRGAAIATVLANVLAFAYLCWYYLSGRSSLRIRFKDLVPDLSVLPEVLRVGSAAFTRVVAGSVLAMIINNSIKYYGTDLHFAVVGVINRVLMFMLLPLFGLVQGLQPIIGFNYGAGRLDRVKEAAIRAGLLATAFSSASFAVLMCFPGLVFRLFTPDPALIAEGAYIMRLQVLLLPLVGFQVVGASLPQALGKALPAMMLSISRQVLFFIPLVLVLPVYFGLYGIWFSFPVADLLASLVTAWWLVSEFRRLAARAIRTEGGV